MGKKLYVFFYMESENDEEKPEFVWVETTGAETDKEVFYEMDKKAYDMFISAHPNIYRVWQYRGSLENCFCQLRFK